MKVSALRSMFRAPVRWPSAYSSGVRTSMTVVPSSPIASSASAGSRTEALGVAAVVSSGAASSELEQPVSARAAARARNASGLDRWAAGEAMAGLLSVRRRATVGDGRRAHAGSVDCAR